MARTIQQPVDHFNASNPARWTQRYWVSREGPLKAGEPVFFQAGPENAGGSYEAMGAVFEEAAWADAMGGVAVAVEHRYFGGSLPFGNASFTRDAHKFLTVENALADYAGVLRVVLDESGAAADQPVVAYGGSYGGFLSYLMRVKYPRLVGASVASGAPVYLYGLVPNSSWYDAVGDSYAARGDGCGDAVAREFGEVWGARHDPAKLAGLQQRLGLCEPVSSEADVTRLVRWAKHAFSRWATPTTCLPTARWTRPPSFRGARRCWPP